MNILKNFYVIEGLDGAGTSTQQHLLAERIERLSGRKVFCDKEPTDSDIGKLIRKGLSNNIMSFNHYDENHPMYNSVSYSVTLKTMAYLFAADRENHLNNPETGVASRCSSSIVLCDRYFHSSLAYQGNEAYELNKDFYHPEVLIFVDTPVDVCLSRIASRNGTREIYENKEKLENARRGYLEWIERLYPEGCGVKVIIVDGNKSVDEVCQDILDKLF